QAADIIFGQLRQVIASMHIEEINKDRDKFLQNIQTSLEPELKKIGLILINVNITDITDESGYIEAIGRKAASQAVQQAKVDVAEQEKLGQVGVAEAEREKAINVANAVKLKEMGTREAMRDQAVRVEAERRAAVEAPAKAEKARVIVEAEAEAEKRRIEAEGQAAAIFAKLDAEARGQYEILAKKGDGLRRIIEACGGAAPAFQ